MFKNLGVIRHDDLDGIGVELVLKQKFNIKKSFSVNYFNIDEKTDEMLDLLESGYIDGLIIGDISPKSELIINRIDYLVKKGFYIKLIDHHDTAIKNLGNNYKWATLIKFINLNEESGASLTLDYLINEFGFTFNQTVIDFIELVRSYDVWDWVKDNNLNAKNLNTLFYIYGEDLFKKYFNEKLHENKNIFNETDNLLLSIENNKRKDYVKKKLKQIQYTTVDNINIAYLSAEEYINDIAMEIYLNNSNVEIVAIFNGFRKVSLRTNKNHINIADFGERYVGGGGSKDTGGFQVPLEVVTKNIEDIFNLNYKKES